jgi:hypothetical protein
MLRVGRDRKAVRADRQPFLALLERVVLGLLDLVADVDDVAVPAVVDPRVAGDDVLDVVGGVAAQLGLEVERPLLGLLDRVGIGVVELVAVDQVARPDDLLEVVEHVDLLLRVREAEVVPGPGQLQLVLAVDQAARVHRVGHRAVGVRVVPRLGEVLVDGGRVRELLLVDLEQLVGLAQAVDPLSAGEDQVVAVARPQLGHHALHRVEVGLAHLHAELLLELLEQLRLEVLRPVEVDEVAVRLRLDQLLGLLLVDLRRLVADPAAGEAEPEREARPAPQQLAPP